MTQMQVPFQTTAKGRWPGATEGAYLKGIVTDPQSRVQADVVILYARRKDQDVMVFFFGMTGFTAIEQFNLDRLIGSMQFDTQLPGSSSPTQDHPSTIAGTYCSTSKVTSTGSGSCL